MSDDKPTLRGCWAKIDRAREHNQRLDEMADAFLRRRPYQVFFDDHVDREWIIVRATVEPMPLQFSAIAGDLIQNLRSSLDHLAWQLVLIEGGTPGRHTSFPICLEKDDFAKRVGRTVKNRTSPLKGISQSGEVWAQLERVQPYNPGYEDFWRVATYSNRDKHQGLVAAVSYVHALDLDELVTVIDPVHPVEIELTFVAPDVLEHGTEIFRVRKGSGGTVHMKSDPPVEISLSDGEVAMGIGGLDKLRSHTVEVIRAFERFF